MGGSNPYNQPVHYTLPQKKYTLKIAVDEEEKAIEVDPEKIPYGHDGLPGSLLDVLLGAGVEIDHACGGVCACSTCHIYVEKGLDSCNESSDDEEDMLDHARGLQEYSRLACQCVPDGSQDVVVKIPEWNRNLAKENH